MKDYAWKIKISDLLTNPWSTDNILFENKFLKTDDIVLWENWIKWSLFLQWLNHDEILLKVENIGFSVEYVCDKCLEKFKIDYKLKNQEEVKFVNTEKYKLEEKIYDESFPIDMKNQTIDIENLIEIIVKNQEPIIKECEKCKNKKIKDLEENEDEITSYTIDFSKLLKS